MAEFPALPLFTDAYMADTRHLTAAQHGAYLLLLMTAWRMPDCKLPDDDKFLARCAAMDLRAWKTNKSIILAFWKQDDAQKWYQGRLVDERKYVEDKSNKNAKVAKARWLKNKETDNANALPKLCQIDAPTPTPTPTPNNSKELLLGVSSEPPPKPKKEKINRGTRLNPEWWVSDEEGDWAMKEFNLSVNDVITQADKFKDYWIAKAGADGVKLDWSATWRNWIRKSQEGFKR